MCLTREDSLKKYFQNTSSIITWQALSASLICVSERHLCFCFYSLWIHNTTVLYKTEYLNGSIIIQTVSVRWSTLSRVAWWSPRKMTQNFSIPTSSEARSSYSRISRERSPMWVREKSPLPSQNPTETLSAVWSNRHRSAFWQPCVVQLSFLWSLHSLLSL